VRKREHQGHSVSVVSKKRKKLAGGKRTIAGSCIKTIIGEGKGAAKKQKEKKRIKKKGKSVMR